MVEDFYLSEVTRYEISKVPKVLHIAKWHGKWIRS